MWRMHWRLRQAVPPGWLLLPLLLVPGLLPFASAFANNPFQVQEGPQRPEWLLSTLRSSRQPLLFAVQCSSRQAVPQAARAHVAAACAAQGQGVAPPGNTDVFLTILLERLLVVDQRVYSFEVLSTSQPNVHSTREQQPNAFVVSSVMQLHRYRLSSTTTSRGTTRAPSRRSTSSRPPRTTPVSCWTGPIRAALQPPTRLTARCTHASHVRLACPCTRVCAAYNNGEGCKRFCEYAEEEGYGTTLGAGFRSTR